MEVQRGVVRKSDGKVINVFVIDEVDLSEYVPVEGTEVVSLEVQIDDIVINGVIQDREGKVGIFTKTGVREAGDPIPVREGSTEQAFDRMLRAYELTSDEFLIEVKARLAR
jgi:hypothetical protein